MSYGYVGDTSTSIKQKVKNAGVLSVSDVLDLEGKGQFGGSLELIAEQTYSSTVTAVDFTDIKQDIYDVHLLTVKNFKSVSSNNSPIGIQLYESGTLETASVYEYALQVNSTAANSEDKSTAFSIMKTCHTATGGGVGKPNNFYCYLYDLGNSSKYSFQTSHSYGHDAFAGAGTVMNSHFGGGVLPQASLVDGIRVTTSTGTDLASFDIKLYGIKQI
jgi:hypothetical protein